jgi:hypothetical protein
VVWPAQAEANAATVRTTIDRRISRQGCVCIGGFRLRLCQVQGIRRPAAENLDHEMTRNKR